MPNLKIDREYLTETLANLIRINSINPTLVPGGTGEAEIAAYVADTLRGLNMDVALHEVEPRRVNVVGRLKGGSGGGKTLMLNGHMDTVGIDNMPAPFSANIVDGKMYGRGAYDMKGGLAACIAAAKAIVDAGVSLSGELQIATVCDEEYASLGTADVVKRYRPDAAIVTEPTELVISLAHKGFIWLEVETIGKAAHGSRPQLGIDANMRMGRFLGKLDQLEQELRARQGHPLIGPPTLHASLIQGGTGLSVISESCKLQIERRTIPGETEAQVVAEIQALIDRLSASDPTFKATVKSFFVRDPFEVSEDAAIVKALDRAATNVLHKQLPQAGVSFWTDAALYASAGIETVLFGPIGAGAHAREEWIDLQSVEDAALVLAQTAIEYCR
ncbi:MAG TPA: ArgE/DapE family deacylase [Anaerolineae bacterium]